MAHKQVGIGTLDDFVTSPMRNLCLSATHSSSSLKPPGLGPVGLRQLHGNQVRLYYDLLAVFFRNGGEGSGVHNAFCQLGLSPNFVSTITVCLQHHLKIKNASVADLDGIPMAFSDLPLFNATITSDPCPAWDEIYIPCLTEKDVAELKKAAVKYFELIALFFECGWEEKTILQRFARFNWSDKKILLVRDFVQKHVQFQEHDGVPAAVMTAIYSIRFD
eukprot:TRINITY_DN10553_c0_g2_i1.p1 TRINITY_DN10553_c0_g2~~TRINITY_DN10553_c0_g2_i1.p1  ORF type:complete len:236 (-),score=41.28 TRINITY_DN10553_c0_g2_i1:170-826(-)